MTWCVVKERDNVPAFRPHLAIELSKGIGHYLNSDPHFVVIKILGSTRCWNILQLGKAAGLSAFANRCITSTFSHTLRHVFNKMGSFEGSFLTVESYIRGYHVCTMMSQAGNHNWMRKGSWSVSQAMGRTQMQWKRQGKASEQRSWIRLRNSLPVYFFIETLKCLCLGYNRNLSALATVLCWQRCNSSRKCICM